MSTCTQAYTHAHTHLRARFITSIEAATILGCLLVNPFIISSCAYSNKTALQTQYVISPELCLASQFQYT